MTPHDLLLYLLLTALALSLLPAAAFCLLLSVRIVREIFNTNSESDVGKKNKRNKESDARAAVREFLSHCPEHIPGVRITDDTLLMDRQATEAFARWAVRMGRVQSTRAEAFIKNMDEFKHGG